MGLYTTCWLSVVVVFTVAETGYDLANHTLKITQSGNISLHYAPVVNPMMFFRTFGQYFQRLSIGIEQNITVPKIKFRHTNSPMINISRLRDFSAYHLDYPSFHNKYSTRPNRIFASMIPQESENRFPETAPRQYRMQSSILLENHLSSVMLQGKESEEAHSNNSQIILTHVNRHSLSSLLSAMENEKTNSPHENIVRRMRRSTSNFHFKDENSVNIRLEPVFQELKANSSYGKNVGSPLPAVSNGRHSLISGEIYKRTHNHAKFLGNALQFKRDRTELAPLEARSVNKTVMYLSNGHLPYETTHSKMTETGYNVAGASLFVITVLGILNNSVVLIVIATNKQVSTILHRCITFSCHSSKV